MRKRAHDLPMRYFFLLLFLSGWVRGISAAVSPAAGLVDAEEANEVRLERLAATKGLPALVDHLARELKERPRPYIKAWYANYLLYGDAMGLKEMADPRRGFALAQEAAAEGSLFGLELVGRAHGDGRGTPRNVPEALRLLREAAARDRDTAMGELAKYHFFGAGVPLDRAAAEEWARKAACRGATVTMLRIAEWWEDPKYTPSPNRAKANALYYEVGELGSREALAVLRERAKKGDADAERLTHLDLVVSSTRGYDALPTKLKASAAWLEANAGPDDLPAQLALAELLMEREGPVFNAAKARAKLERAVGAGSDEARAMLALMAWRGIGQKKDEAAAVAVWRELADKGNARALNQLGWLHWWGNGEKHGLPKDAAKSFALCQQAAGLGYWAAQLNLAECHAHGIGTPVNYHLAVKYYRLLESRRYIHATRMKNRILAMVKD